jgi:hypothetical protein
MPIVQVLRAAQSAGKGAMSQERLPSGWDEERVNKVLEHYEGQIEDEATAEDEAALEDRDQTFMEIPNDLVPEVRALIAKHQTRA